MKKILLTIMAVAFVFSLAAPVMAKGVKVPKTLCLESTDGGPIFLLGLKKGNKLSFGTLKLGMYTLQGVGLSLIYLPAYGTGYTSDDTFFMSFSLSGGTEDWTALGAIDLADETGSLTLNKTSDTGLTSTTYSYIICDDDV